MHPPYHRGVQSLSPPSPPGFSDAPLPYLGGPLRHAPGSHWPSSARPPTSSLSQGGYHYPIFDSPLAGTAGGSLDGSGHGVGRSAHAIRAGTRHVAGNAGQAEHRSRPAVPASTRGGSASHVVHDAGVPGPSRAGVAAAHPRPQGVQGYTIIREIGGGGAGKAFLVTGDADGKRYVAKQQECLGDQYNAARASYALQEARMLFLLQHPNVCAFVDFYPKSSAFFIVMEFCEQGDLGRHIAGAIKRGNVKFDAQRVFTWWYQILDAMEFCHAHSVLHRDLKPKNIFIDGRLNAKVGDFGVVSLISSPPATERVGTTTYHSPEVRSGLRYSTKSDIWAIGVIMWETMSLRPAGGEPVDLKQLIATFAGLIPVYGQPARQLIMLHLTDDPSQRPEAGVMKETLLQLRPDDTPYTNTKISRTDKQHSDRELDASELFGSHVPNVPHDVPSDSDTQNIRGSSGDFTDHSQKAASIGSQFEGEVMVEEQVRTDATKPEVFELCSELGISAVMCGGNELGAWKLASLTDGKPAAESKALSVGEYLWEINGKVIFGMPLELISSLLQGTSPDVKMGVKTSLNAICRSVVIRRKGEDIGAFNGSGDFCSAGQDKNEVSSITIAPNASNQAVDASPYQDQAASLEQSEKAETKHAGQHISKCSTNDGIEMEASPVVHQQHASEGGKSPNHNHGKNSEKNWEKAGSPVAFRLQPYLSPSERMPSSAHKDEISLASEPLSTDSGEESKAVSQLDDDILNLSLSESLAQSPALAITRGSATIAGDGEYVGELNQGKPFGNGTATWLNQGHTYVGEWRNGVMHGVGTATYLNGDRYDGEWAKGKRCGLGRYSHGGGDIFEGVWSNERKHGLGVDSFADGRGYRGEFSENKFSGLGSYFTVDGAVYQGDWLHGRAHGTGAYLFVWRAKISTRTFMHASARARAHARTHARAHTRPLCFTHIDKST